MPFLVLEAGTQQITPIKLVENHLNQTYLRIPTCFCGNSMFMLDFDVKICRVHNIWIPIFCPFSASFLWSSPVIPWCCLVLGASHLPKMMFYETVWTITQQDEYTIYKIELMRLRERIHPGKLTCPLKRDSFNRKYIFQPSIFRDIIMIWFRYPMIASVVHSPKSLR